VGREVAVHLVTLPDRPALGLATLLPQHVIKGESKCLLLEQTMPDYAVSYFDKNIQKSEQIIWFITYL